VIEHNLDVIKTADWLIDMGPEGGSRGGLVIGEGTPEQIAANPRSYTGDFLRPILAGHEVPVGNAQPELIDVEPAPGLSKGANKGTGKKVPAAGTTAARSATKTAVVKRAAAKKAAVRKAPAKKVLASGGAAQQSPSTRDGSPAKPVGTKRPAPAKAAAATTTGKRTTTKSSAA